jgi:hypothetical protein
MGEMKLKNKKLSYFEEKIIAKKYGAKAKPALFEDKSIEGLIKANCTPKETGWKVFFKGIGV